LTIGRIYDDFNVSDLDRQGKMFSIREIIDMAIQLEKNAETFYREALARVSTPILEPVLVCLADEEREHTEWFERLKRVVEEAEADGKEGEISGAALRGLVGDQKFSLAEVDLSEIDNPQALIELFYQMLQSFIQSPETTKELDEIIAQEDQHIKMLQECEIGVVKA
jgi:rubrerythrin